MADTDAFRRRGHTGLTEAWLLRALKESGVR